MKYYIWSFQKKMWWGPYWVGYTKNIQKAGVYTEAEAYEVLRVAHNGGIKRAGPPDESMVPCDVVTNTRIIDPDRG